MSATGSLMIRNLRTQKDYNKAVLAQDELLRIAVSNDRNIAAARKSSVTGEIPTLTPQQSKSPTEIQADTAQQEGDVIKNLQSLGFRFQEVQKIVGNLTPDQIFKLNQTFPALRTGIEKVYDVKLLTPTFFLEYLNQYFLELDKSKGMIQFSTKPSSDSKFDVGVSVNEVRQSIPSKQQLKDALFAFRNLVEPQSNILSRSYKESAVSIGTAIDEIMKAVPSDNFYSNTLAISDDRTKSKTLEDLMDAAGSIPSRKDLVDYTESIEEGSIDAIEAINKGLILFGDIRVSVINKFKEITGIDAEAVFSTRYPSKVAVNLSLRKDWKAAGVKLKKQFIMDLIEEGEIPNTKEVRDQLSIINSKNKTALDTIWETWNEGVFATETLQPLGEIVASPKKTAKGLKIVKIGKGIQLDNTPEYREFGKFIINHKQLVNNDILNVKYKSLAPVPQFKTTPVSDIFKDFVVDLLDNGKVNRRMYDLVPVEERKLFERMVMGAGLVDFLKIKKTITNKDKDDLDRFNLLKGEYLAGNNSDSLMKELRRFVLLFMNDKRINRAEGLNLLMELSV